MAYAIQGVAVSDFITPHFYDPIVTNGTRYSFTGAIKAPRQVLPGGYISFVNQDANEVQQILWVDPNKAPTLVNLGPATGLSLREMVDNGMRKPAAGKATFRTAHGPLNEELLQHCKAKRQHLDSISRSRGKQYEFEPLINTQATSKSTHRRDKEFSPVVLLKITITGAERRAVK